MSKILTSNISLVKGPLGLGPSNVNGVFVRGWEGFISECLSASVPASAHGEAMRTLVIHKMNFGPNPQRRLSVPVLMISSV